MPCSGRDGTLGRAYFVRHLRYRINLSTKDNGRTMKELDYNSKFVFILAELVLVRLDPRPFLGIALHVKFASEFGRCCILP